MQEKAIAFSISLILPKVIFISAIGLYTILNLNDNYEYLVKAHFVSVFLVAIYFLIQTRQAWLPGIKQKVIKLELLNTIKFGFPLIFSGIAFWGLTATDKVFLRSMSTYEELGIYSVSVSFAGAAMIVQSVFSTLWAPTVYKWAESGDSMDKVKKVSDLMLFLVITLFCLVGIFAPLVDYILPAEYAKVKYLLVACMAYPLFYTLSEVTSVGIGITKKTQYSLIATVIALLVNLVGNYTLIPIYGASGAAAATAVSFFFLLIFRSEFSFYLTKYSLGRIKLYFLTALVLIISLFILFFEDESIFGYLWSVAFLITLALFRKVINVFFINCKIGCK